MSGTDLYAGGYFTTAGEVPANNIAKWDGSAWSALGSGMDSLVYVLAVSGTDLYVGGGFTTAGGVAANSIAKWNGSAWSALGSGMHTSSYGSNYNSGVYALAAASSHLFVGGDFLFAGPNVSPFIAKAILDRTEPPTLTTPATNALMGSPVSVVFTLPEAAANGTVTLSFGPTVLTLANTQGTAGAHAFTFNPANPTASPEVASGSAIPDGTYTVTLSYQDALGNPAATAASSNVSIAVAPYSQWKLTNLGSVSAPDTGNPDADAFDNLAEYGLVLSPTVFSAGPVNGLFTYPEGDRLRIVFTRDPARNDVTLTAQGADDVAGPWTPLASSVLGAVTTGAGYYGGDSAGPGLKTVEVRDLFNLDDPAHPRRFVRLQVSH